MIRNAPDFYKQLGKKLRRERRRKGLTQKQLADLVGVSYATICNYETGYTRLPVDILVNSASVLEITIHQILNSKRKSK